MVGPAGLAQSVGGARTAAVRALRPLRRRRLRLAADRAGPGAADPPAGAHLGGLRREPLAAHHTPARRGGRPLRQPDAVAERHGRRRNHPKPIGLDLLGDLRVGGGDLGGPAGPVAQPGTQRVRRERKVPLGQDRGPRHRHGVVEPLVGPGAEARGEFRRSDHIPVHSGGGGVLRPVCLLDHGGQQGMPRRVGGRTPGVGPVRALDPDLDPFRGQAHRPPGLVHDRPELRPGRRQHFGPGHAPVGLTQRGGHDVAQLLPGRLGPVPGGAILRPLTAAGAGGGAPLVLGIGHDDRAVAELDLVAGAAVHDLGGSQHPGGAAVRAEEHVAGLDLAHRGPAGRGGQRGIQGQGLAQGGAGGDDDHLPGMQAVGQRVEVAEAGGDAGEGAAAAADGLDLVEGAGHDLRERVVVVGDAAVGDAVDLGFGAVDQLVGVAVAGIAELDDAGADLDQAAEDGPLADDAGVVAGVGGGGHRGDERVQVGGAADAGEVAALGELGRDGHRVGRLAAAVQVEDDLVDQLVGGAVVVVRADDLEDVGDRVLGEQHAAQDALLGGDVVRRGALEVPFTRSHFGDAHRRPPPPLLNSELRSAGRLTPFYRTATTVSRHGRRGVQSPLCTACGNTVQTRRRGCAHPGDTAVETAVPGSAAAVLPADIPSTVGG